MHVHVYKIAWSVFLLPNVLRVAKFLIYSGISEFFTHQSNNLIEQKLNVMNANIIKSTYSLDQVGFPAV